MPSGQRGTADLWAQHAYIAQHTWVGYGGKQLYKPKSDKGEAALYASVISIPVCQTGSWVCGYWIGRILDNSPPPPHPPTVPLLVGRAAGRLITASITLNTIGSDAIYVPLQKGMQCVCRLKWTHVSAIASHDLPQDGFALAA